MSGFTLRLFGPFALAPKLGPLSRKGQWLLSLLALRHGREVDRAWLAGTLWPDTSEELALYNLRRELSRLRRTLGPEKSRLQPAATHALALAAPATAVDVIAFDEGVARGDEASLKQAVGLYTGPLLEGCTEEWVVEERRVRAQAYLTALDALAAQATKRGDPTAAVRYLRFAVAVDPLRESSQRHLIEALAAAGSYAAATRTYRDLRLVLGHELSTDPAPETRALHERVITEARAKASPPASSRRRIPRLLTRLVGRNEEIRDVAARVGSSRLVTLVGAGGVGKSRLAIEVAQAMAPDFAAGTWFVELAPIADPALVPSAVASTIGLRDPSPRPMIEALREFVRSQPLLLVLDNCEHLIGACTDLATALLASCRRLHVLVTSRQPLGIVGEVVWRVPSLTPSDAVQLFLERAEEAQATSSLRSKLDTVTRVCRQLDGIPLAIELAASRIKALAIDDVAARLGDRFELLTGGSRAALPRHQTLRATMDWSYHLLSHAEQRLLRRLCVFAGGWTLEAAEEVCDRNVVETLSALIDKSLVVFDERYGMLETVRQYAREQLSLSGEEAEFRDRHLRYFVAFTEKVMPYIWGGERDKAWMSRLEEEHDNVRAAFDWAEASTNGADAALRLVHAVHWFWFARSHIAEGRERTNAALRRRVGTDEAVQARALVAAGFAALWAGDFGRIGELCAEAQTFAERLGDHVLNSYAHCGLGASALYGSNPSDARPLFERAVAIARGIGDTVRLTFACYWLGSVNEVLGDFEAARVALDEAFALAEKDGSKPALAHVQYRLGHCAHAQGLLAEARCFYVGSLDVFVETGEQWGMSQVLDALGCLEGVAGDAERATVLLGAADALRQRVGAQILPSDRENHERGVRAARAARGDEAFSEAWAKGRALPLAEALEMARALA